MSYVLLFDLVYIFIHYEGLKNTTEDLREEFKYHHMGANYQSLSTWIPSLDPTMYIAQTVNPPGYYHRNLV